MAKAYLIELDDGDDYLEMDEMDGVKMALAYMLLNNTEMDADTVFSLVFQDGSRITWH